MLIALIDDGIDKSAFPEVKLIMDLSVTANCTVKQRTYDEPILTNHGTTCAKIITKYSPTAEFCSLRIFHSEVLSASCDQLVAALKWCYEQKVPIIHLSVGTSHLCDYSKIRQIIAKIVGQRQVVIAAHNNINPYSLPACLAGVFGVALDDRLLGKNYKIAVESSEMHYIQASSFHEIIDGAGVPSTTQLSNSYAAPTITAAIHTLLQKHIPFTLPIPHVYHMLAHSIDVPCWMHPDFIDDAYILNLSGIELLKEHLFFRRRRIYTSFPLNAVPCHEETSLVYLPPQGESEAQTMDVLIRNKNFAAFERILYGGVLPINIKQMLGPKLVWSEDRPVPCSDNVGVSEVESDCPVINIYGEGICSVAILCQLRDLFLTNGYQCFALCDYPFAYLYGLEFYVKTSNISSVIAKVKEQYRPDVILSYSHIKNGVVNQYSEVCYVEIITDANVDFKEYLPLKNVEKDIISAYQAIVDCYS